MENVRIRPNTTGRLIRPDYEDAEILTYAESADSAGVSVTTIRRWLREHNVLRVRGRGAFRVDRASLEAFMEFGIPQG